ncbi:Adenine deaminase [Tetrabaena socialis]|uniref:glycerophosphodiester phosphodiesterase n=1 Tax=Tetrabaena socialis TaxID=47790 RepID=A0A2J8A7S8_9CHLO|nr:Adenine deaminase [Tetrabaena socialis]|eukprot:PNH08586.1 Adenine deaminase [Tetrabaena socialis]
MVLVNLVYRGLAAWFPPPRGGTTQVCTASPSRSRATSSSSDSLSTRTERAMLGRLPTGRGIDAGAGQPLPPQGAPIDFPLLVYSHRGGNLERVAPGSGAQHLENTLPAFRHSAALGVDLLELDVQLTRDGRAAVFHDADLGRMCGPAFRGKRVADFDFEALPPLLPTPGAHGGIGRDPSPSTAASTSTTQPTTTSTPIPGSDPDCRRIPLLDEVMAAFPAVPLQIDLKVASQQLVAVVAELVAVSRREHTVLWGSFLHSTNTALYAANPRVPLFASAPRGLLLLAAHCAGQLHRVHVYERAVIMPLRTLKRMAGPERPGGARAWWRPSLELAGFFSALHARGVKVVLFGDLNDEASFAECLAAGAAGICTDHPSRLMRWLAARKLVPKAELHIHIEGTLEPAMMLEFAARNGLPAPYPSVDAARAAYNFTDLQTFLDLYYFGCSVLRTRQDFYELAMAYFKRAAANNVVHAEETFMGGLADAARDAKQQLGITSSYIMCFRKELSDESANATLDASLPWHHQHIAAVGLDSTELGNPPSKFVQVFDKAAELGLLRVSHAGEEGPPDYVWQALKLLHVKRVDHGIRSLEDPLLMAELNATRMPLTVCPISNVKLKVYEGQVEERLRALVRSGLLVTINSDDAAYFGAYVSANYEYIAAVAGLDVLEVAQLAANSFEASFYLPGGRARRQKIVARIYELAQGARRALAQ